MQRVGQPAFERAEECHHTRSGWAPRVETPLHQVWRHRQAVATVCRDHELAFGLGPVSVLLHQLADPILAHPDTLGQQFLVHAWPAVFALDFSVDGSDLGQHGLIAFAPTMAATASLAAPQPVEIPTGADLQHLARQTCRVLRTHLLVFHLLTPCRHFQQDQELHFSGTTSTAAPMEKMCVMQCVEGPLSRYATVRIGSEADSKREAPNGCLRPGAAAHGITARRLKADVRGTLNGIEQNGSLLG